MPDHKDSRSGFVFRYIINNLFGGTYSARMLTAFRFSFLLERSEGIDFEKLKFVDSVGKVNDERVLTLNRFRSLHTSVITEKGFSWSFPM